MQSSLFLCVSVVKQTIITTETRRNTEIAQRKPDSLAYSPFPVYD